MLLSDSRSKISYYLEEIVQKLRGQALKVVLYGSYVRGHYREGESDIDILIITKGKVEDDEVYNVWLKALLNG